MKKIVLLSPPFSGHLNVLKDLIRKYRHEFDFYLIITGWINIKPDLTGVDVPVKIIAKSELRETDPAIWTLPRAAELLELCVTAIKDIKPDLIIYDFFSIEGKVIGKMLGIPYWCSIPALVGPFLYQEYLASKLRLPVNIAALKSLGGNFNPDELEMISDGLYAPGQQNLIWSYPSLTPEDFMTNRRVVPYLFVGNLSDARAGASSGPVSQTPLIYFSFGTVVIGNLWDQQAETRVKLGDFVGTLARLWADKPFEVLFNSSGRLILAKYPSNWRVVDHADQISALSRASVFVTHAGGNSFHEAVIQKVPMVAVPFFGDQPLVARQIEKLGLGRNMVPDAGIDTRNSKDFLNADLAKEIDAAVADILNNLEEYKKRFSDLPLEAVDVGDLLRR